MKKFVRVENSLERHAQVVTSKLYVLFAYFSSIMHGFTASWFMSKINKPYTLFYKIVIILVLDFLKIFFDKL